MRWDSAFKRGDTSIESHPALPQDRDRHEALKIAIGDRLRADRANAKYLKARFKAHHGVTFVEWSEI